MLMPSVHIIQLTKSDYKSISKKFNELKLYLNCTYLVGFKHFLQGITIAVTSRVDVFNRWIFIVYWFMYYFIVKTKVKISKYICRMLCIVNRKNKMKQFGMI